MATISANALGVYQMPAPDYDPGQGFIYTYDQTKPFGVAYKTETSVFTASANFGEEITGTWNNLTGITDFGIYMLMNVDGSFDQLVSAYTLTTAFALTQQPELMSAATSTTIEATNTVNETVARNGAGASTTYIVSGAMSWSMSVDGLLDLSSAGVGSSLTIMDAARRKNYVLVKFDTGTTKHYVGQALIDNISLSGGVDDIATYSASFSGYGDLYEQVVS
jgi:hypothetical protein